MKKKIVYATMIMSTIALLSTGFAAWVITGNGSVEKTGNIAVDTVSNESRIITDFSWNNVDENKSPTIRYGMPQLTEEQKIDGAWFENDGENGFENLEISATFKVSNISEEISEGGVPTYANIFESIVIEIGTLNDEGEFVVDVDNSDYQTAYTQGLVTTLPAYNPTNPTEYSKFTADSGNGTEQEKSTYVGIKLSYSDGTFTISVKFGWGRVFDCKNPYEYYNNQELTADLADEATTKVNRLAALLDNKYFNLKIVTKAPADNA